MPSSDEGRLRKIAAEFRTGGETRSVRPLGSGHIHDSFVAEVRTAGGTARFVLQRINRDVFPAPERVMHNIRRVTDHLRAKLSAAGEDPERGTLTIVPARVGGLLHHDADGECWRAYRFIEGARAWDVVRGPDHAREACRAFARFGRRIADLPEPPLHETIAGFGDTRRRLEAFRRAVAADARGRAAGAAGEIAFAREREDLASLLPGLLEHGEVPRRTVHHDTKIDNVLIDDRTGEGVCVIDLDTVMPGTSLYDFGDSVRFAASRGREDEPDPSRAGLDLGLFEQVARGWLEESRELLTPVEIEHLVPAARALTFVAGLRFLTDFLEGDRYFKTARAEHNLERCRAQFVRVADIEARESRLREIVERHARARGSD